MMLTAVFKYTFPFEVYKPVVDGTLTTWVKERDDVGSFLPGSANSMYLTCKEPIDIGSAIRNLTDFKGNPITNVGGASYDLYVQSMIPQMDPYGLLVAWRHTLRDSLPRDFEQLLLDRVGALTD